MHPTENQVTQPEVTQTEAYRVADNGRAALAREGYDGRIPKLTTAVPSEELGKQARDITVNAYKTEKEHGFEFAKPEYKRAIEIADRVDQKAMRDQLAALKNQPPEPGHATRQGRVAMVTKEDTLNGAINAPVTTRVNYALACLRNGRPEDVVEAKNMLDRAVQLKPELRQNKQFVQAIEYADKQGQARRAAGVEAKKEDPYGEHGGTANDSKPPVEDPYSLYGGTLKDKKSVNDSAVVADKRPFADRKDLLVPPPPDFAPFYGIIRSQDVPKPPEQKPPVEAQKPKPPEQKPPQGGPFDGGAKPPVEATKPNPPSDRTPPVGTTGRPGGSERDDARERKDNSDLLKYIAGAAAAAGGIYGAFRLLNNRLQRNDDLNRAANRATLRVEPERDPARSETEIRNRATRELLDKGTWDPKTQTFADKEGKRVSIKDVDVEFKIGLPAGVDAAKYQEEQRVKMKGQLDLELRGQQKIAGLLNDVKVVADEKAPAGSNKMVLKQADGNEGEIQRRTQDGRLEIKRADGKVEVVDVQATDKVEVRVGGKDRTKSYSQRDAISDVAYKLGRQSDIEFAKMLADHGGNMTHNQLAKRFEEAAKTATGEMKTFLEAQAADMKKQGDAPLDRNTRATIAETLRAEAATRTSPVSDQLNRTADIIMPQEVAKEVQRQAAVERAAAEKAAAEKAAADKAAADKAEADRVAAEKAAADKAAADKAEADRVAAEKAAADKAAADKAEADRVAAEKAAADKAAADKAEADRVAAEKAAADKAAADKAEADRVAAEKAAADKAAADKAEADRVAAEKAAADKAAADKAEADRVAAEKAAADKAAADKAEADRVAAEKAAADKAEADKAAADKAEADKAAADKAAADKAAADKTTAEKPAGERPAGGAEPAPTETESEGTTRRRRKPGELSRTETSVNGDGSITRVDGEVGSIAEIAKRGKLHKPEIRGIEAALATMKEEQGKTPTEERALQIKETQELVDRLNGVHGEPARAEAHRSVAEACKRQLDLRGRAGAVGGTVLSIGVIAVFAMQLIRDNNSSGSPYQRPGIHSGS